eukprot:2564077-Amphidinium_carterae.1
MGVLRAAQALLILIDVDEVNVDLVLEAFVEVDVGLVEVQVNTVGNVEVFVLDAVLPKELGYPLL